MQMGDLVTTLNIYRSLTPLWIIKSNFWLILSGKPGEGMLPPINQSINTEMDSRCSANIITESLGANCCPGWFNKIWQTERKAQDFNMKASQESPVFPDPAFSAFFFFFLFFLFNWAQHNLKSSLGKCNALLRLPEWERKWFGSLSSIKYSVGSREGWSNLPVEAITIPGSALLSVLGALPVLWHSGWPKRDKYGLCLRLQGLSRLCHQQIQEHTCDTQCSETNVCVWAQPSISTLAHISWLIFITERYCASVELMKSWKDFFSVAGTGRNICIICAGSAEKKGTSGGSCKLLIEEICFILFGGGREVKPNYKTTTWGSRAGHTFLLIRQRLF